MAGAREFPEDKFAPSSLRRIGDPASGMFDSTSPDGIPLGQMAMFTGAHGIKRAMDFVQRVKNGEIDPNSDEGLRQTLDLALLTLGRQGGVSRPGTGLPRGIEGEILAAEPRITPQLGVREPTVLDQRAMPSSPMGRGTSGDAIRGTSAEGAPRLTRIDPLTRYSFAGEQGQRIGPNRPSEALRPEVDMMYSPTGRNEFAPNVTTESRLARLGDESPLQADRIGAEQAAARARQAHSEFLDELRAAGEGMPERGYRSPTAPPDVPPSRPLSVPEVADAPRSPFLDMPTPGVRSRPAEVPLLAQQPGTGFEMVNPPSRALALRNVGSELAPIGEAAEAAVPQNPLAAQRAALADAIGVESNRNAALAQTEAQRARLQAAIDAASKQRAGDAGSILPSSYTPGWGGNMATMGGIGAGTAALIAGSQEAQRRTEPVDRVPEGYRPQSAEDFQRMLFGEPPVKRQIPAADADSITAGYDVIPAQRRQIPAADADSITAGYDMPAQRAKTTAASVLGGSRAGASAPAAPAESRGFLSNLISSAGKLYDPDYQKGMTSQQLFAESNKNPDDPAAFFRADKRWKEENPNYGQPQAEKRGGAVEQKPSKEAMLHKSLEIIHHMIRNR